MILPMITLTEYGTDKRFHLRGDLIDLVEPSDLTPDAPPTTVYYRGGPCEGITVSESADQIASSVAAAINFTQTRAIDAQIKLAEKSAASVLMMNGGKAPRR